MTGQDVVVPVTLDLREFRHVPRSADECVALWERLEPVVLSLDPRAGPRVRFDLGDEGEVGVWFLDPATAPQPFGIGTRFAIRGVLEPSEIRHVCTVCRAAGTTTYAPYTCAGCDDGRRVGRVCEAHAVFLDGSLRASCTGHAPACPCGRRAAAWCSGPDCRTRKAWCETHLRRHPGDPAVAHCEGCYAERFPACEHESCTGSGYIRCEYRTLSAMKPCGRRICIEHARRWQVYGSHSRGLALCTRHHQQLPSTSPEALIDMILAGTVARSGRGRSATRRRVSLPRISIVRHILINTRRTVLDMEAVDGLFSALETHLRGRTPRDTNLSTALDLLTGHRASRREDIERFRQQHLEGHGHYHRLVQELHRRGRHELAEAVTFSDYRPRSGILFVHVPARLQGLFRGKGGSFVRQLEHTVGVRIQVERG
ncbi:KH domain-containing protein [Streptomyces sp. NPDC057245]|uniref:KH domain-containing protein n=1 Tax=Streptomyces sp. NPDC057245 TaxID=3346065 RepID=UPI00363355F6